MADPNATAAVPAAVAALAAPFALRGRTAKNRVALPPMVITGLHPDCVVTDETVAHYRAFAEGGAGFLVQEATAVSPDGKLHPKQLGLWEDAQTDGMRRLVEAVRPHGGVFVVQIHHAPVPPDAGTDAVERIVARFADAAVRAERAGYDGVELHGAHGYLLSRFHSTAWNRRTDRYGDPERLVLEVYDAVRAATSGGFLVGIRLGADNPGFEAGIALARSLDRRGIDFLDVSNGYRGPDAAPPAPPEGYPFSALSYRAAAVRPHVKAPVIGVGSLNDPAVAAAYVAAGHADFAAVGRGQLVDPAWTRKALSGAPIHACMECPGCQWFGNHPCCPGRQRADRLEGRISP